MMITGWENSTESWMGLKCTEAKYAKTFVDVGQVKFSTPQSWVDRSKKNIGRGDPYEGMIAAAPNSNMDLVMKLQKKYSHLRIDQFDDWSIFRSERDMLLPCFCFYCISTGLFDCPKEEGTYELKRHISERYFSDFDDKEPAVVMFPLNDFLLSIKSFLFTLGINEEEIIIQRVQYIDFNKDNYIDLNTVHPYELFIKTRRFAEQEEGRIVINTKDPKVLKVLEEPIEIGQQVKADYFVGAEQERVNGLDVILKAKIRGR